MTPRCGVEQLPDDFSHTRSTVPLIFEARCWLQMQKITIKGQEAPECKKNKYNKTQVHDPIKAAFMSKQVNIQSFHTYYITLITISLSPTMTDCFDFCRRLLKCSRDHKRDIGNDYKHRELLLSPAYQWVKPVVVWLATSPPPPRLLIALVSVVEIMWAQSEKTATPQPHTRTHTILYAHCVSPTVWWFA